MILPEYEETRLLALSYLSQKEEVLAHLPESIMGTRILYIHKTGQGSMRRAVRKCAAGER